MARIRTRFTKQVEESGNPFWISYADLMTALVMLFLVIMSISMVAIATRPLVEKKEREVAIQEILDTLEQRAKQNNLDLKINRATRTIHFGDTAVFDFDSFQLSKIAQEKLQAFVPLLLDIQSQKKGNQWLKRIHIEGYTDASGTYLYNINLSLNRAQAVVCTLVSADLTPKELNQLRKLLIIDGASITGIKENAVESRRVEVRLEFRGADDHSINRPVWDMPIGNCAIRLNATKKIKTPNSQPPSQKPIEEPIKKPIKEPIKEPIKKPIQKPIQEKSNSQQPANKPPLLNHQPPIDPSTMTPFSNNESVNPAMEQLIEQVGE